MGWRDDYKVDPAADVWPMMPDEELAKLGEDIKKNGLISPISFFVSGVYQASIEWMKDNAVLADGRNRMEAMERAGIPLTPCAIEAIDIEQIDPAGFIIGRNALRRHQTQGDIADCIIAAELARQKPGQVEPVSVGGRGKVNRLKAKLIIKGKQHGVSESTMKRRLAKATGKKASGRHRRTEAEIKRDQFLRFMDHLGTFDLIDALEPTAGALDLLTAEEIDNALEFIRGAVGRIQKVVPKLRARQQGLGRGAG